MDTDFLVPYAAPARLEPELIRRPDGSLATERYVEAARQLRADAMGQWLDGLAAWARARAVDTRAMAKPVPVAGGCPDPTGA